MDGQVEDNGNPGNGGGTDQLGVAEESGSAMVVAVQEGQGLLLEEQEDGVQELQVLGEVVELCHVSYELRHLQERERELT